MYRQVIGHFENQSEKQFSLHDIQKWSYAKQLCFYTSFQNTTWNPLVQMSKSRLEAKYKKNIYSYVKF